MPCEVFQSPTLGQVFVCSRGPKRKAPACACGKPSAFQCDHAVAPGRTCDRHLCRSCRVSVGPELDYCPEHAAGAAGPLFAPRSP